MLEKHDKLGQRAARPIHSTESCAYSKHPRSQGCNMLVAAGKPFSMGVQWYIAGGAQRKITFVVTMQSSSGGGVGQREGVGYPSPGFTAT